MRLEPCEPGVWRCCCSANIIMQRGEIWNLVHPPRKILKTHERQNIGLFSSARPPSTTGPGVTSHIFTCIWWFRTNKPYIFWKPINTSCCQNLHKMNIIWRSSYFFISFPSHLDIVSLPSLAFFSSMDQISPVFKRTKPLLNLSHLSYVGEANEAFFISDGELRDR